MTTYAVIPNFGQLTEYITQGPLVGGVYGVVINRVKLEDIIAPVAMDGQPADNLQVLQTIKADYAKVSAINASRMPTLTPDELATIKILIATSNHDDTVKYVTDGTPTALTVITKLLEVKQLPVWEEGLSVQAGQVYRYEADKNLYVVVEDHKTQKELTPPDAKSLWKRFYEPKVTKAGGAGKGAFSGNG